jgi:hypothetical protein
VHKAPPVSVVARGGRGGASSPVDERCGAILLVGDVLTPGDRTSLVVDFLHRYVGHEASWGGTVPVVLAGLEEHAVAREDHLDRPAAALAEADALGDVDYLPEGVGVPRGPRAPLQPRRTRRVADEA